MKLMIAILHYKEPVDEVTALLSQINAQQNFSFTDDSCKICIYNGYNGEDISTVTGLEYQFNLELIQLSEQSLGEIQNRCIQDAINFNADYIMWMDSTGRIINDNILSSIQNTAEANNYPEVIVTPYVEERIIKNSADSTIDSYYYLLHDDVSNLDTTHGKVYNVNFLKNNNIEFPDINAYADMCFNYRNMAISSHSLYLDSIFYFEPVNLLSLSRQNDIFKNTKESVINKFINTLYVYNDFCDQLINNEKSIYSDKVISAFLHNLYYLYRKTLRYGTLDTDEQSDEIIALKTRLNEAAANLFKSYINYYNLSEIEADKAKLAAFYLDQESDFLSYIQTL